MPENLPKNLSLEHLKKQAKQLLKAFQQKDDSVFPLFKPINRYAGLSQEDFWDSPIRLHDAQYAIALKYGFQSWQQLSRHCTQINKEDNMSKEIIKAFNQLKGLENRAMQSLLRQVDSRILAMALYDADEEIKQKVFVNMSQRALALIMDDIDGLANASKEAVIKSKGKIIEVYQKLLQDGEIGKNLKTNEPVPLKSEPIDILKKRKVSQFNSNDLKDFFYELAKKAHNQGLLQLENDAQLVDDEIIKKGLELITDGTAPALVESILRAKLEKAVHDFRMKYEGSINAILDIQKGHYPQMVREKIDAFL